MGRVQSTGIWMRAVFDVDAVSPEEGRTTFGNGVCVCGGKNHSADTGVQDALRAWGGASLMVARLKSDNQGAFFRAIACLG